MSQLVIGTVKSDSDNFTIIPVNKQAKFLKEIFPNDLKTIFNIIEDFKIKPKVIFFNSPDFDEYINILVHGKHDSILELANDNYKFWKLKPDHLCEIVSRKKILKKLVPITLCILFTEWNFKTPEDEDFKNFVIESFKEFLRYFKENTGKKFECFEEAYLRSVATQVRTHPENFVRIDLQPHQLPIFKLRKKTIKKVPKTSDGLAIDKNHAGSNKKITNSINPNELFSFMTKPELSWIEKSYCLKKLQLQEYSQDSDQKELINKYSETLAQNFTETLQSLQLIDGYGENNEPKLRELVDSIIDDKFAGRTSNKLIIGPQGTGKSSFAKLLGLLMGARIITIECGPLTDNSDLFGSYEIMIDPETRQAITIYNENGFMYASKLVKDGFKVVLAVEEYNLLPSETLLKQLNRFFQDRIISSFGGRYEINLCNKEDIIVIMTGNHDFNQDWLNDVGLIRRFEFFEFPLPSTESVVECLYKFVVNTDFNIRLTYECAERIAEIRDDLVSSLNEKTIRPILSKEIKYPDIYTMRNFAIDLIHGVDVSKAVKRWLVKIILGGIPNESDLREEYLSYTRIIQTTVEDRLPEIFIEKID